MPILRAVSFVIRSSFSYMSLDFNFFSFPFISSHLMIVSSICFSFRIIFECWKWKQRKSTETKRLMPKLMPLWWMLLVLSCREYDFHEVKRVRARFVSHSVPDMDAGLWFLGVGPENRSKINQWIHGNKIQDQLKIYMFVSAQLLAGRIGKCLLTKFISKDNR